MLVSLELPCPSPPNGALGAGKGTGEGHTLASGAQLLGASRLEPGVSRLEGILVSVQGNLPFCRGGGQGPERGSTCRDPQRVGGVVSPTPTCLALLSC